MRKTSDETTKLALCVHIASIAFVYPLYGYTKALVSRFRWGNCPLKPPLSGFDELRNFKNDTVEYPHGEDEESGKMKIVMYYYIVCSIAAALYFAAEFELNSGRKATAYLFYFVIYLDVLFLA